MNSDALARLWPEAASSLSSSSLLDDGLVWHTLGHPVGRTGRKKGKEGMQDRKTHRQTERPTERKKERRKEGRKERKKEGRKERTKERKKVKHVNWKAFDHCLKQGATSPQRTKVFVTSPITVQLKSVLLKPCKRPNQFLFLTLGSRKRVRKRQSYRVWVRVHSWFDSFSWL